MTAPRSTPTTTPVSTDPHPAEQVIADLFTALYDRDADAAMALLDERIVYTNVGLSTLRGRKKMRRVVAVLTGPVARFQVFTLTSAVATVDQTPEPAAPGGVTVLNERIDEIAMGRLVLRFWVCGKFVVEGGRLVLWRDYFDLADIAKAGLRALIGVAVPGWNRQPPR